MIDSLLDKICEKIIANDLLIIKLVTRSKIKNLKSKVAKFAVFAICVIASIQYF